MMSRLAEIYGIKTGAETAAGVAQSMKDFWSRQAASSVRMAVRMRMMAKEARQLLKAYPDEQENCKNGCGGFAAARRYLAQARKEQGYAIEFGSGVAA